MRAEKSPWFTNASQTRKATVMGQPRAFLVLWLPTRFIFSMGSGVTLLQHLWELLPTH